MCELFGISTSKEMDIRSYLSAFYSHSDRNPHGWGLVLLDDIIPHMEKEAIQASRSKYLQHRLHASVFTQVAMAHIRDATIGHIEYENCHPFVRKDHTGRIWTLVHNGTIFGFSGLNIYTGIQEGQTDSERILMYIVDRINAATHHNGHPLNDTQRAKVIDHVLMNMSYMNKLNILLYDGVQMYVHSNYRNSLYMLENDHSVLFATKPLSQEVWHPIPFMQVLAFQAGHCVYHGLSHPFEYLDDKRAMELLYLAFSNL